MNQSINEAIYEAFANVKRTHLVRALEPLSPDQNIAVKAPIREGKTFAVCYKIATSNKKVLYVVRTHEQAKEVAKRLTALGVSCAHVAGKRWENFNYRHDGSGLCWTPAELWQLLSKKRRRNIVKHVSQMARDGLISAVVTVPEIAIHFKPKDFDILVLDEEAVVYWFKPESQLLFSYDRDFGHYTEDSPLERAYKLLENDKCRHSKYTQMWVKWAKDVNEVIKSFRVFKDQFKTQGEPHPEKKVLERVELELNAHFLPYHVFNIAPKNISKVVKLVEYFKKKPKLDDKVYDAYNLISNSLGFIGFNAFTTKDGGRVWGIVNTDHLLFKEWLNGFKAVWLVLNKTSKADEWVFSKLNRNYKLIKKESFRFAPWFTNVVTNEPFKIAKILYDRGVPTAWVVGRKKDARKLEDELRKHGIAGVIAEKHTKEEIEWLLRIGHQVILYLNSRVSKGIDLPLINVVFVYNYAFAVPDGNAIKTMRDELEQVILRCSPIDEDDPVPRMIIWCHKNERSQQEQEFINTYLNERAEEGKISKSYRVEKLFKSNWLPLVNISVLPISLTANTVSKQKGFFTPILEMTHETVPWAKIRHMLADHSGKIVIENNSLQFTLPEHTSLLWYTLVQYAKDENEKKPFLNTNPESLDRFWDIVKGKTTTRKDVITIFRSLAITNQFMQKVILNTMERAGLLKRHKEGRRVRYEFVDILPDPPKPDETVEVKSMIIVKKRDQLGYTYLKAEEEPPKIAMGKGDCTSTLMA